MSTGMRVGVRRKAKNERGRVRQPPLRKRQLLAMGEASLLGDLFRLLASPTRLRLLHALEKRGETAAGGLADEVGMKAQAVSNQLQRLAAFGIIEARRDGQHILYRIVDPCLIEILDYAWCLAEAAPAYRWSMAS